MLSSASSPEFQPLITPPLPCSSSPHTPFPPSVGFCTSPRFSPRSHCCSSLPWHHLSLCGSQLCVPSLEAICPSGWGSPCPGFMLSCALDKGLLLIMFIVPKPASCSQDFMDFRIIESSRLEETFQSTHQSNHCNHETSPSTTSRPLLNASGDGASSLTKPFPVSPGLLCELRGHVVS